MPGFTNPIVWGEHASRVLVVASRRDELLRTVLRILGDAKTQSCTQWKLAVAGRPSQHAGRVHSPNPECHGRAIPQIRRFQKP